MAIVRTVISRGAESAVSFEEESAFNGDRCRVSGWVPGHRGPVTAFNEGILGQPWRQTEQGS